MDISDIQKHLMDKARLYKNVMLFINAIKSICSHSVVKYAILCIILY